MTMAQAMKDAALVEADGLIRIDTNTEGLYKGQKVKVMLNGGIR